ncbi:uncharacterized protein LOC107262869 [Cephus cinctus]|uniref:Uncharacterized protein LOC107262869 n=1 Tax=Cephus cinctus TaxID=211228 RepID=A0AAJ7FCG0_CEPCN|nr:uncharacterized protein LOC107262869 [Cephus cinctus]
MFGLILVGWILIFVNALRAQDITFPNETTNTNFGQHVQLTNESTSCPLNMKLYYNEEEDNQFCDCDLGFIYYPPNNSCYLPYRKGPCSSRKYLILGQDEAVARCKKNPCLTDGLVMFNGTCHELGKSGTVCNASKILGVHNDAYSIGCIEITFPNRNIISAPLRACRPGTRRVANGTCRTIL